MRKISTWGRKRHHKYLQIQKILPVLHPKEFRQFHHLVVADGIHFGQVDGQQ